MQLDVLLSKYSQRDSKQCNCTSYTWLKPLLLQQVYHRTTSVRGLLEGSLQGGLHSSFLANKEINYAD